MARILVTGATTHVAARRFLATIVERLRQDGHDGRLHAPGDAPAKAVRDADAVVALLDGADIETLAAVAYASALEKPVLGLADEAPTDMLRDLCTVATGRDETALLAHLRPFYDRVRPFAGRVVRDLIPKLVKEAGHDVLFREVAAEHRPRYLKQKVAAEAAELARAELAQEKEEVADVLEALEAFIESRGFSRDDLRRVKEAKNKRRGGFSKVYIVESSARDGAPQAAEQAPPEPATEPPARGTQFFEV